MIIHKSGSVVNENGRDKFLLERAVPERCLPLLTFPDPLLTKEARMADAKLLLIDERYNICGVIV
jgi:hypothetical protein